MAEYFDVDRITFQGDTYHLKDYSIYEKTISEANAIQSFDDGAEWPMGMQIAIEPVQAGNGDPSPSNVRAISGFGSAIVVASQGVNIIPDGTDTTKGYKNNRYLNDSGNENSTQNNYISEYFPVIGGEALIYNASLQINNAAVCFYDENRAFISGVKGNNEVPKNITVPANARWARCTQFQDVPTRIIQLERGTVVHTVEPFKGNQYTITFPFAAGTVYGGTVTVNPDGTGTLVVDHKQITLDGSEGWTRYATGNAYYISRSDMKECTNGYVGSIYCDRLKTVHNRGSLANDSFCITGLGNVSTINYLYAKTDGNITSASDFETWLSSNNLTVVYPLATPVTYTLTPGQVLSLIGQNNVWADTGDILSLTYNSKQGIEFIREDTAGQIASVVNPVKTELDNTEAAMAIVVDGDTAPKNITSGQYVFVKNHSTLATGMYHATAAIASGASVTSNNVSADGDGVINAITTVQNISSAFSFATGWGGTVNAYKYGRIVHMLAVIDTFPTLTANTRYAGVIVNESGNSKYNGIMQLHTIGWQSDNYRDYDNIVHISGTGAGGMSICTGDSVNGNPIRFNIVYITSE